MGEERRGGKGEGCVWGGRDLPHRNIGCVQLAQFVIEEVDRGVSGAEAPRDLEHRVAHAHHVPVSHVEHLRPLSLSKTARACVNARMHLLHVLVSMG